VQQFEVRSEVQQPYVLALCLKDATHNPNLSVGLLHVERPA
jgi:hypothetical protein